MTSTLDGCWRARKCGCFVCFCGWMVVYIIATHPLCSSVSQQQPGSTPATQRTEHGRSHQIRAACMHRGVGPDLCVCLFVLGECHCGKCHAAWRPIIHRCARYALHGGIAVDSVENMQQKIVEGGRSCLPGTKISLLLIGRDPVFCCVCVFVFLIQALLFQAGRSARTYPDATIFFTQRRGWRERGMTQKGEPVATWSVASIRNASSTFLIDSTRRILSPREETGTSFKAFSLIYPCRISATRLE